MSTTIGYYFNSELGLSDLGKVVNRVLGCRLESSNEPDDLYCRFCSIETSLHRHDLDDDRDIEFSSHPYELQLRVASPDLDLLDHAIVIASQIPSLLWLRARIEGGRLVHDLQRVLARYATTGGGLVDAISGVPVLQPGHLLQIHAALQRR